MYAPPDLLTQGNAVVEDVAEVKSGSVSITIEIRCSDVAVLTRVVSGLVQMTAQLSAPQRSQMLIRLSAGSGGRRALGMEGWRRRFQIVRRILETSEGADITLEQACAREGIPYSTFRYWRLRMQLTDN